MLLMIALSAGVFLQPYEPPAVPEPLVDHKATLRIQLVRQEGMELGRYTDINGNYIIGIGHNISANSLPLSLRKKEKITVSDALYLLDLDLAKAEASLDAALPWTANLDPVRRAAFINLTFNLGIGGLLKFEKTLEFAERQDWTMVAKRLKRTLWTKQVGRHRTRDITTMLVKGKWPTTDIVLDIT